MSLNDVTDVPSSLIPVGRMSGWHILICTAASCLGSLCFLTVVGREVDAAEKNLESLSQQLERSHARRQAAREAEQRIAAKKAAKQAAKSEA